MPMSETPIVSVLDEKSEQLNNNAEYHYLTGQSDQYFAASERGLDTEGRFDLDRDDAVDPRLWTEPVPPTVEAPAAAPKTYEQKLEESLMFQNNEQLLAYASANTKAIVMMRHLV